MRGSFCDGEELVGEIGECSRVILSDADDLTRLVSRAMTRDFGENIESACSMFKYLGHRCYRMIAQSCNARKCMKNLVDLGNSVGVDLPYEGVERFARPSAANVHSQYYVET